MATLTDSLLAEIDSVKNDSGGLQASSAEATRVLAETSTTLATTRTILADVEQQQNAVTTKQKVIDQNVSESSQALVLLQQMMKKFQEDSTANLTAHTNAVNAIVDDCKKQITEKLASVGPQVNTLVQAHLSTVDSTMKQKLQSLDNTIKDRLNTMDNKVDDKVSVVDQRITKLDNIMVDLVTVEDVGMEVAKAIRVDLEQANASSLSALALRQQESTSISNVDAAANRQVDHMVEERDKIIRQIETAQSTPVSHSTGRLPHLIIMKEEWIHHLRMAQGIH